MSYTCSLFCLPPSSSPVSVSVSFLPSRTCSREVSEKSCRLLLTPNFYPTKYLEKNKSNYENFKLTGTLPCIFTHSVCWHFQETTSAIQAKEIIPWHLSAESSISLWKLTHFVFLTSGFQPWEEDKPHSLWFEWKMLVGTVDFTWVMCPPWS